MDLTIIAALSEKRRLSFSYDGHPRIVEPHCYGITKAGKEAIRCYQVSDAGMKPDGNPWHLMNVSMMEDLHILAESFSDPRPGYKKGDEVMTTIFVQL